MTDEAFEYLAARTGFDDVTAVSTYHLYTNGQPVTVLVHDRGPDAGSQRYSAEAFADEVPEAERTVNAHGFTVGNPDSTIKGALINLHWNAFS